MSETLLSTLVSTLVLYHGSCADGFTAAWVYWRYVNSAASFQAVQYGDSPPDVTGKDVVILDFSWPRDVLEGMKSAAASLIVLDHHKTAKEELAGLGYCTFDMSKSGAMLAWERYGQGRPPKLVGYVQDRDLWTWALPDSREVNASIASRTFDFDAWDVLALDLVDDYGLIRSEGRGILRYQSRLVDSAVKRARRTIIAGHNVPILNATMLISEIGERLCVGEPFSVTWFHKMQTGEDIVSLRSAPDGEDVGQLARLFGGGGHKHAAGFETRDPFWRSK